MSNSDNKNDDFVIGAIVTGVSALVGGIVGYLLATKNITIELPKDINDNINIQKQVIEIDKCDTLEQKVEAIHKKIHSNNWIEIQGAIIVLFAELEKLINSLILKSKNIPKLNLPKRLNQLYELKIIDEVEHNILNKIIPTRNNLVHGKAEDVNKDDIYGCEKIITDFIIKYK